MDSTYRFKDQEEAGEEFVPHKDSALGQFSLKLGKAGAHAFEDFSDRDVKLLLRWSEYWQLNNLMALKDNAGSPQSVAFFSGRQSVFEYVSGAATAILTDREAKRLKDKEENDA